jgi:hypothetical protein
MPSELQVPKLRAIFFGIDIPLEKTLVTEIIQLFCRPEYGYMFGQEYSYVLPLDDEKGSKCTRFRFIYESDEEQKKSHLSELVLILSNYIDEKIGCGINIKQPTDCLICNKYDVKKYDLHLNSERELSKEELNTMCTQIFEFGDNCLIKFDLYSLLNINGTKTYIFAFYVDTTMDYSQFSNEIRYFIEYKYQVLNNIVLEKENDLLREKLFMLQSARAKGESTEEKKESNEEKKEIIFIGDEVKILGASIGETL